MFEHKNEHYLIVDYYSKYPFVYLINNPCTSKNIIHIFKCLFAEHGIPHTLLSDNGRQYSSSEFSEFAKIWDFKHITSSPYYPRSNGLAERMVQTNKRVLHKTTDFYKSLLLLRTTPINCYLRSPAELLFNRRLTTILPSTTHCAIDTDTHRDLLSDLT